MDQKTAIPLYSIYREAPREADLRFIHVETISARHRLHNWNVEPHRHRGLHQAMLWTRGAGSFLIEGETRRFRAPALVAVPSGAVHGFRLEPGSDALVVTISDDFLQELAEGDPELGVALSSALLLELDAEEVAAHELDRSFAAIEREYSWSARGRVAAIGAHLRLALLAVLRLRAARAEPEAPRRPAEAEVAARLRALIEEHFRNGWSVADYARALAVTPARLNAVSRSAFGQSVLGLVHARTMTEAKRLLYYTAHGVAEIGYSLGFRDPAYFSRFFARRAGEPPSAYRDRHGGGG